MVQAAEVRTERMQTPFGGVDVSFSLNGVAGLGLQGAQRFDSADLDDMVDRMLVGWPQIRNDAASSIAFARGLEYIYAEVYEIEFPKLRATEFIPLSTEVPAGSLTYTYRMYEKTGAAAVIHNFASDLPLVGYKGKEFPSPVVTIGCAYSFSIVDIERAAKLDVPLESMLANACRWAIEFLSEQVAALGLPNEGVPGLTTLPGVTSTAQLSTGTWLHQLNQVAAATAAAPATAVAACQGIISDVNALKSKVFIATKGLYDIDQILLSTSLYSGLRSVPRSPAFTNDNILDYIESVCHVSLDYWPQLDSASGTGHGRLMAYQKDPQVLKLVQPRPFTQFAPQNRNLAWIVPCIAELGGVEVHRPLAVTYMDGLDDTA
jgi:hypothetical protein